MTFAASIPALILIQPVLNDPGYITGAGQDTRVLWGCLLDFVNALAGIGCAVAVFRRQANNESMALGFVMSRMLEAAVIMIGVVSLLAVVTLRAGPRRQRHATGLATTGQALVAVRDWTFLFGPGFMAGLQRRSCSAPCCTRRAWCRDGIPTLGLIGAPLLFTANIAGLFGHNEQVSGGRLLRRPCRRRPGSSRSAST